MATFNCIPSQQTVSPCPTGTAPDVTSVESSLSVERYEGHFDHIPSQDLIVGVAMVLCLVLGIGAGRR